MANQIEIKYIDFSMDGNAARKLNTGSAKVAQLPNAKRKTRRVITIDPLSMIGVAVAVCMLFMLGVGAARLQKAQAHNQQMAQYVESLTEKNTALQAEFDEVCDLEHVRQMALALGMIPKYEAPVTQIAAYEPPVETVETLTLWEQIGIFLAGLFA